MTHCLPATACRKMHTSSVDFEEGPSSCPSAGEVVCGKYRLIRPLGEGGMGLVFEAEHLRLRESVAIKFLRPEVLALPDAVERFEREARASARIRGPHVVQVLDVDTDDRGRPYMVMELLRGRDLEAELRACGPLPIEGAVDLVLQACVAVAQAHAAGIVHRDLKPSNLFVSEEGGKRVLKVLDFGISKIAPDAEASTAPATSMYIAVGTPLYMSPEQMRSSRDVDGRSDIWSLGVILYELMAGTPPFLGTTTAAIAAIVADAMPSIRRVRPDVPEELERVLITALAKSPVDRLPTAEALAAALMPFASAEGLAGPFSLRPSQRDFALASNAIARSPSSPRISDVTELFGLPSARAPTSHTVPPPAPTRPSRTHWSLGASRDALRTFAGTLVVGMCLASAVTVVLSTPARTRAGQDGATCVAGLACASASSSPAPTAPASAGSGAETGGNGTSGTSATSGVRAGLAPWAGRSPAEVPREPRSGLQAPLALSAPRPDRDAPTEQRAGAADAPDDAAPLAELASEQKPVTASSGSVPTGAPRLARPGAQGGTGMGSHRPRRVVPLAPYL
jgi:serine/threonine protein kinase